MRLEDKVALVTGAAQGIGRAVALKLAQEGARIVVADLNLEGARAVAAEVEALERATLPLAVDVRKVEEIRTMVDATVARFGRIDIAVPCAGIVQMKRLLEVTEAEWDRIFSVNARGLFFTVQRVGQQMVSQKAGAIVTMTSISGQGPRPFQTAYAASKAAVISITKSAAAAFAPHGVTVNAIAPGIVDTPMWDQIDQEMVKEFGEKPGEYRQSRRAMIPLGRLQTPEDIANAVAFLASPEASNITGQTLNVDGGFYML